MVSIQEQIAEFEREQTELTATLEAVARDDPETLSKLTGFDLILAKSRLREIPKEIERLKQTD